MHFRPNICNFACLLYGIFVTQLAGSVQAEAPEKSKSPSVQAVVPPALPTPKAPIEYFRELLAMPVAERERSIADKSEEQKKILRAKIKEYESLPKDERELRLAVTELRWYLVPLMRMAPADRGNRLEAIPAGKKALIEDRLKRWDELSHDQQKEFLENELTTHYFLRLQSATPEQKENILQTFPEDRRQKLEEELARWRSLPREQRERMSERFEQFFSLNPKEKEKALNTLSETERLQMEKTLRTYQNLPPEQRKRCIESFEKLARMDGRERIQFLRKAQVWEKMSSDDRKTWRKLVDKFPQMPPLPPGLDYGPPLPPSPLVATNSPP